MKLINGNCLEELNKLDLNNCIIVSDPPFNMKYHYNTYKDNLPDEEYYNIMGGGIKQYGVIHLMEEKCLNGLKKHTKQVESIIIL